MFDQAQSNRYHDAEHAGAACANPLQPAASDLIRVGSRRWFLQTGLRSLAGLSLPALLQSRARATTAGGTAQNFGDSLLALRWSQPHRYVGPQTRCPRRDSRSLRDDRHQGPRPSSVRALAAAGQYHGPADLDPLGGLPGKPRSSPGHHAIRQHAVAVANVRRRRPSPVDGLARRAVSRAEPAGHAGLRRPGGSGELLEGRRLGRRPSRPRLPAGRRRRVRRAPCVAPGGQRRPRQ